MLKEKESVRFIDKEELAETLTKFRSILPENQAFALAFINGMKLQKRMDSRADKQMQSA